MERILLEGPVAPPNLPTFRKRLTEFGITRALAHRPALACMRTTAISYAAVLALLNHLRSLRVRWPTHTQPIQI
jgi:hypothetical protein